MGRNIHVSMRGSCSHECWGRGKSRGVGYALGKSRGVGYALGKSRGVGYALGKSRGVGYALGKCDSSKSNNFSLTFFFVPFIALQL